MDTFAADSIFAGHGIRGEAGRGGMGIVYRATHIALKRDVAMKVISPRVAVDEQFRERFRREAEAAASIQHPNVVPVYDAGEEDGFLYVTMRFVEGVDLAELLRFEGQLAPDRAVQLIAQVAGALDAAHQLGVIHRDVKPANVLIEGQGPAEHALLTDFGLTKHVHSESGLTETGALLGTIDYAAPELLDGSSVDARTDVYALGCVLYELLIGQVPYPRSNVPARIFAHLEAPVPPVSAQLPDAPPALEAVIRRAMSKRPEDRYASAGELGRAAHAALTQPAETEVAPPPAEAQRPPRAKGPARRRRRRVAGLTALGTVAGVVVGMLLISGDAPRSEDSAALAVSPSTYRAQIVKVCQRVNASELARRRDATVLSRKLRRARTTAAQRDAILVATRASISRGGSNLAALRSLEPPDASRALHASTAQVWDRSLDRSRQFSVRLDASTNRPELLRAIAPLTQARAANQEDAVELVAGLQRLGGSQCSISRFSERPVPLPPLRGDDGSRPDVTPPAKSKVNPKPSPTTAPQRQQAQQVAPQATAAPSRPDVSPPAAKPVPSTGPDVAPPMIGDGGDGGG